MPIKGGFNKTEKGTCSCEDEEHIVNKFGVTYYHLGQESGDTLYPGDAIQGCSLLPNQVDANFNFLHGDDIKDGKFDSEDHTMVLNRHFDGKEMSKYAEQYPYVGPVKISTEGLLQGSFDSRNDELTLTFNGSETKITGFTGEASMMYTDKVFIPEDINLGTTQLAVLAKETYPEGVIPKGSNLQEVLVRLFGNGAEEWPVITLKYGFKPTATGNTVTIKAINVATGEEIKSGSKVLAGTEIEVTPSYVSEMEQYFTADGFTNGYVKNYSGTIVHSKSDTVYFSNPKKETTVTLNIVNNFIEVEPGRFKVQEGTNTLKAIKTTSATAETFEDKTFVYQSVSNLGNISEKEYVPTYSGFLTNPTSFTAEDKFTLTTYIPYYKGFFVTKHDLSFSGSSISAVTDMVVSSDEAKVYTTEEHRNGAYSFEINVPDGAAEYGFAVEDKGYTRIYVEQSGEWDDIFDMYTICETINLEDKNYISWIIQSKTKSFKEDTYRITLVKD